MRTWLRARINRIAGLGVRDTDSDDVRLRKEALALAAVVISLLSCFWVSTYAALGLWAAAAIPFAYQVASVMGLVHFARTKDEHLFRRSQLALMLLLPFALQWTLGGFVESSAVALWGLSAPFAALVYCGARESVPWFGAFLVLLGVSAVVDPLLPTEADIPSALRLAFFTLNVAGISFTAFLLLQYFVRARERAHAALLEERERSERLLLNILPESIAERLKAGDGVIADRHADVSVLFADIAGFTPASERLEPEQVVGILNAVFSGFDELVEARSLEKIKTIGDGYMVAAGIPTPRADHSEAIVDLALAMQERFRSQPESRDFELRIGIDTGPVVAGVIGRRSSATTSGATR